MRRTLSFLKSRTGLALVIGGALLGVLSFVAFKRNDAYHYDVDADYIYDFAPSKALVLDVPLRDGKITLPINIKAPNAAFLKVKAGPGLLGSFFEPQLIASVDGHQTRLTLERGAHGARYLNLAGLPLAKNASLEVTTHHASLEDQTASLLVLKNEWATADFTVLVVSPHPDDAEIGAYGLYSAHKSYVVTVTAGEAGEAGSFRLFKDRATQFREKGRVRAWNSVSVPMLGNVPADHLANLGYFDGTLEAMHATRTSPVVSQRTGVDSILQFRSPKGSPLLAPRADMRATWVNLVADLRYVLEQVQPDVIAAPYPPMDNHPDHQLTTIALLEAVRGLNLRRGKLLLYTNHFGPSYMYPFGPAGDPMSLPPSDRSPYFDSIFSNALSPDDQARKLLALDAMIDLREDMASVSAWNATKLLYTRLRTAVTGNDSSYRRRAGRSTELFFVVDFDSIYDDAVLKRIEQR